MFHRQLDEFPGRLRADHPSRGLALHAAPDALGATPVWDPEGTRKISAKTHHQKIDFNIFENLVVKGIPSHTLSEGKVVWANGKLDAVKGAGRYIDRPPFPISYKAVAKMNQAKTPRAVVRSAA